MSRVHVLCEVLPEDVCRTIMGIVVASETKEHFTQAVLFELSNNRTFSCNDYFYRGQMRGFDPHGYGQMWFKNGDKYEGQCDDGLLDGMGTMSFKNGDTYKGQWKYDYFHGVGEMWFNNGDQYEGHWQHGHFDGHGTMLYANGDTYTGEWGLNTRKAMRHEAIMNGYPDEYDKSGYGTMTYANGDVYEGQWENDMEHGDGTMTYANGDVYEGQWESGVEHGNGTMTYANGDVFEGQWEYGGHTEGKRLYANGGGESGCGFWSENLCFSDEDEYYRHLAKK